MDFKNKDFRHLEKDPEAYSNLFESTVAKNLTMRCLASL